MKTADTVDAARVELFLADLRLPAIKQVWTKLAEQSDKEGWPAARFLAALAEHEIADRGRRRIERHLLRPAFRIDTAKREHCHLRIPFLLMRARARATVRVWKRRLELQAHSRIEIRGGCGLPVAAGGRS